MSWKRLATFVSGGALVAAGLLIPGAQALVPAGAGLLGLATSWPGDKKRIRELERSEAPTRVSPPPSH